MRAWKLLLALCLTQLASAAEQRPNVLLMMADDLAATLGCYGHPAAKTPHLDALAGKGTMFTRAYCQFPHCNPSRSSMMSGLRPDKTGVSNNEDNLYKNIPDVVTMPHYFRQQGYQTARCGKIFHLGVPSGLESMDDPKGWDFGTPFENEAPYPKARESAVKVKTGKKQGIGWKEIDGGDDLLCDGKFASTAVDWLEQKRDKTKPFLLAVGFHRPHLPLVAPAQYFDLYPMEGITLPEAPADDEADIPEPARNGGVPGYKVNATPEQRRAAIRAYLACVSYVDAQAGKLLAALDKLGLRENTIVIFTSDHGWHLGEHGLWHKRSLFEESARVPFIMDWKGAKANGQSSGSLIELLDVYPTLCDLCGLERPTVLQGASLREVLVNPTAKIHDAAFTQARRGQDAEIWGRSVRTERWRCTEWEGGAKGIELYDHDNDPFEYRNLAADPASQSTLISLRQMLKERLQR
jgi:choline-sulfatase